MPEHAVARFILKWMLVPVALLWLYHLAQRRHAETAGAKRYATLYLTGLLLAAWVLVYAFLRLGIPDPWLALVAAAIVAVAAWQRRRVFPWRLGCAACAKPLDIGRILFRGDNRCAACAPPHDTGGEGGGAPHHDGKEALP
jgi:hypothetical protein